MAAAEDDLRAQLESAFKEHSEPEAPPSAAAPPEAPATDTRARDERGRFVSGAEKTEQPAARDITAIAAAPTAAAPPSTATAEPPAAAAEPKPAVTQALAPPNGWSAEAKAKWHELPPEIQAAVNQREQDVAKFTSKTDEERQFGREMQRAVAPYLAQIQSEGGTPAGAVQSLLNTAYILRNGSPQQKQQALLGVAQQFNIQLPTPGEQPQIPPELHALYQRINQLEGSLNQFHQGSMQATQATIQSEIEAFAADPAHQHFQEVKAHMAALLKEGLAPDLQSAYDQACYARPDIRTTLLAQQRASEEQKRIADQKAQADAARRKAVSINGGPGISAAAAPADRSLREELLANMRAASGAV